MKAEWDDAPLHVRRKKSHFGIIVSLLMVAGVAASALYIDGADKAGEELAATLKAVSAQNRSAQQHVEPTRTDDYDEQVNRLLRESAELETNSIRWADREESAEPEKPRQTEFNDRNHTPRTDVNIARLNTPSWGSGGNSEPQQNTQRSSYVTVVEETKRSCWPFKPGSRACREHKQQLQQIDQRSCDLRGNQAACDRANRYGIH